MLSLQLGQQASIFEGSADKKWLQDKVRKRLQAFQDSNGKQGYLFSCAQLPCSDVQVLRTCHQVFWAV